MATEPAESAGHAEAAERDAAVAPCEPVVPTPDTGYTEAGVPTLEGLRDKIEARYGTALGATELAGETPEARDAAERFEARRKAAEDKLAQIRAEMRGGGR